MIAEVGLGDIQTVFGADVLPRPEFSNTTFLQAAFHYGLMKASSMQTVYGRVPLSWVRSNQPDLSTKGIQVGAYI